METQTKINRVHETGLAGMQVYDGGYRQFSH